MRKVEEIGQKSKRKGYLQGTGLWKWRNIIVGGVVLATLAFDVGFMYYFNKIEEKKRLEQGVPDMSQFERLRTKLDEVSEQTNKISQPKTKIPAELKDILASINQGK